MTTLQDKEFLKAIAEKFKQISNESEEQKFYVYYNDKMIITGISPIEDDELGSEFQHSLVPVKVVRPYMEGKRSLSNCVLVKVDESSDKYYISEVTDDVKNLHFVQNQANPIPVLDSDEPCVYFHGDGKKFSVSIINATKAFEDAVQLHGNFTVFLTKHEQPDIMYYTYTVDVVKLLEQGEITFDTSKNVSDCDLLAIQRIRLRRN